MRSFAVIGLGEFGASIASYIEEEGGEVIAIEIDPEKVRNYENEFTSVVEADATDIEALRDLGISDVDAAIVSIGTNMGASILITLLLKELKVPLIIVKAMNQLHGKVLKKVGANSIVFPEKDMAKNIAWRLMWPDYKELELAPGLCMIEISAPKSFINKNLGLLELRKNYDANIIAIKKKVPYITEDQQTDYKEKTIAPPNADTSIDEGDTLILVCPQDKVEKFKNMT
ncbi:MAG: TrkA family potassium uptake protein [Elusimicrobia bacterium]|nr:TrkA family potassium uptake protein [Elusimicrobiota bacterium]